MTTPQAAANYLQQHLDATKHLKVVVYNPNNVDEENLPVIYGFNNGGNERLIQVVALAEDGTGLDSHYCSNEQYLVSDLEIVGDSESSNHIKYYRSHYPQGYRMEYVPYDSIKTHDKLQKAISLNQQQGEK